MFFIVTFFSYICILLILLKQEHMKQNKNVFENIRTWATIRGLYEHGDSKTQFVKLCEEQGELARGLIKKDKPLTKDSIGDMVVVLTNLAHLEGFTIEECIDAAWDEIKSRTGKMENGSFVKDE